MMRALMIKGHNSMMNRAFIFLLLIGLSKISLAQVEQPLPNDGWVHLQGKIVNGTCVIETHTRQMYLDLDQNDPSNPDISSLLELNLDGCQQEIAKQISFGSSIQEYSSGPIPKETTLAFTMFDQQRMPNPISTIHFPAQPKSSLMLMLMYP